MRGSASNKKWLLTTIQSQGPLTMFSCAIIVRPMALIANGNSPITTNGMALMTALIGPALRQIIYWLLHLVLMVSKSSFNMLK
jgi:hypothetical protein